MTYQIKRLADAVLLQVSSAPIWSQGVWECGDQRFTDPGHNQYSVPTSYALLTPVEFHDSFSVTERIKLKASPDAIVQEFWKTFELAASQPGTMIDPNGLAVVGGLAYLAGATQAPLPVIDPANQVLASAARIAQIQAGLPGGF